jgi:O-antigen ligase
MATDPIILPDDNPLAMRPRVENPGSFTFLLLSTLLFFLFFRPADLITSLQPLHLPMVLAIICMGVHISASASRGEGVFRLTPITKALAAITLWTMIAIPFAYWQAGAFSTFINQWLKMVVTFLLMANIIRTVRQVTIIIWICVISAIFVSLTAIGNYLVNGAGSIGRLTALVNGPYSGANYFSVTIDMMLPFVLFFLLLHPRPLVRVICVVGAGILVLANLMTQSRAGIVGMLIVMVAVLWDLRKRWKKSLVPILALAVIGGPVAALLAPHGIWDRFSTIFEDYDVSSLDLLSPLRMAASSQEERVELIFKSLSLTLEYPVFGVGMGNFSSASAGQWNTGTGRDWIQTHNTYLQFSAELGIPGVALYFVLLVATFKTFKRARDQVPNPDKETDGYMLALICDATRVSMIGYLLTSMFANVGYQPYYFVLAGIGEGVAFAISRFAVPVPEKAQQTVPVWPPAVEAKSL